MQEKQELPHLAATAASSSTLPIEEPASLPSPELFTSPLPAYARHEATCTQYVLSSQGLVSGADLAQANRLSTVYRDSPAGRDRANRSISLLYIWESIKTRQSTGQTAYHRPSANIALRDFTSSPCLSSFSSKQIQHTLRKVVGVS